MAKKTIPFKGNYWWGNENNVISILEKELKEVLSSTRVGHIEIIGSDFNDGKQFHHIKITVDVSSNKITVEKSQI
ncbi:MAG: hypothetical protein R3B55_01855 [Candidatus Paceibacterota bacterium]